MAVGIGHIVDGRQTYVAGAPRKVRNFGQVLLYVQGSQKLELQFAFDGEQIASGFGYDLTVGDFNGDGYVRSSVFPETVLYSTLLHTTTAVAMVAFYLRLSVCLSVCLSVSRTISQKPIQLCPPTLTEMSFGNPFILGSKCQRSRSRVTKTLLARISALL